ncbi:MAG: hypothetical protein R3275_10790 [Saprospiraceae bacterium]|nr:hypothetical protein [Saprospiraceae bacterium]
MNELQRWRVYFEVSWWAFTIIVVSAILLPILIKIPDYPFLVGNILFIVVFLTFYRWIFLLKYSWFAKNKWIKLIIMFLALPVIIVLLEYFTDFQRYVDDYGLQNFMSHLSYKEYRPLAAFIRFEMIFFGVGSIIATIMLAFRMIISIWRYRNRGKV